MIDQWHLRRDAATIQQNTCELRYLKQQNIKNLFIKLTWTLRICHFRRRKWTKTNWAWLTPWQQHILRDTGQLSDWSLMAKYDGLARRFFVFQFFYKTQKLKSTKQKTEKQKWSVAPFVGTPAWSSMEKIAFHAIICNCAFPCPF